MATSCGPSCPRAPPTPTAAKADLVDHTKILVDGVATFRSETMLVDVRTAADGVAPAVDEYLKLAAR